MWNVRTDTMTYPWRDVYGDGSVSRDAQSGSWVRLKQ
jgi:hypothetical protein